MFSYLTFLNYSVSVDKKVFRFKLIIIQLYKIYVQNRCASPMGLIANRSDITWTPIRNNDISWNFQKWLIASDGHPYKRYTSRTTPAMIENDIKTLISQCVLGNNDQVSKTNQDAVQPGPLPQPQSQMPVGSPGPIPEPESNKFQKRFVHDGLSY